MYGGIYAEIIVSSKKRWWWWWWHVDLLFQYNTRMEYQTPIHTHIVLNTQVSRIISLKKRETRLLIPFFVEKKRSAYHDIANN